jgi:hypothetical protein
MKEASSQTWPLGLYNNPISPMAALLVLSTTSLSLTAKHFTKTSTLRNASTNNPPSTKYPTNTTSQTLVTMSNSYDASKRPFQFENQDKPNGYQEPWKPTDAEVPIEEPRGDASGHEPSKPSGYVEGVPQKRSEEKNKKK